MQRSKLYNRFLKKNQVYRKACNTQRNSYVNVFRKTRENSTNIKINNIADDKKFWQILYLFSVLK